MGARSGFGVACAAMQRSNNPPSGAGGRRPAGRPRPKRASRQSGPTTVSQPRVRSRDIIRVPEEVAGHVRDGHPWIFREALKGRKLDPEIVGGFDVVDRAGHLVGRALYDPIGAIALRVFSRRQGQQLDAAHVGQVVQRAADLRRQVLDQGPDDCCRVLNGDSEGLPAVNVDRYGPYLVIIAYSGTVEGFLEPLVAALGSVWRPEGIYLQRRYKPAEAGRARPGAELLAGRAAPLEVVVSEGRVRFVVDVTAPLGTGLFADMRLGRREVARRAAGRRVLNCFSYTGAFTVVAALHGATKVVSVDNAARAHSRARRNLSENGLDPESRSLPFITGDVFATLARLADRGERFDLVILDPPSFFERRWQEPSVHLAQGLRVAGGGGAGGARRRAGWHPLRGDQHGPPFPGGLRPGSRPRGGRRWAYADRDLARGPASRLSIDPRFPRG